MEANSVFDKSLDAVPEVPPGSLKPWEPISTRSDDWTYHYAHSGRGLLWAAAIPARSFLNNRLQVITQGYSKVGYRTKVRDDATICMATDKFHNTLRNRRPTKLGPAKSVDVTITPAFKEGDTIELQYTPDYIPVYKPPNLRVEDKNHRVNELAVSVPLSQVYKAALLSIYPDGQDDWADQQSVDLARDFDLTTYAGLGLSHEVLSKPLPNGTVVKFSGGVVRQTD